MKRKSVVLGSILIGLGVALLGLSSFPWEARTQIAFKEGPFDSSIFTVFLEKGQLFRAEIIVEPSELGRHYTLRVTQVENQRMLFEQGGPVDATVVLIGFRAEETAHYEIDWYSLPVSRITAYIVDNVIPQYIVSTMGGLVLAAGTVTCLLGFEWKALSRARKTRIFWRGLILFGLALVSLFAVVWYTFVLAFVSWRYSVPWTLGSVVFLLIGFYMMRSGIEKE